MGCFIFQSTLPPKTQDQTSTHYPTLKTNPTHFYDRAVISVKSIFGPFRVAVLWLCHDLLRLALHARDRLERPRRVALGRHLDVDYGAILVEAWELWAAGFVVLGKTCLYMYGQLLAADSQLKSCTRV